MEPMKCPDDRYDVLVLPHPHQDPDSSVLNVLELLEAPARDEECVAVV